MTAPGPPPPDVRAPARPPSIALSALTVSTWTLVSRVTGLLRVVVTGAVLGPTFLANTFLTANNVPNLAYSVVAGPVLALVVVPAVVRALVAEGRGAARLYVQRLSGLLLTVSAGVALLLVPVALALAPVVTAGVPAADRGRAEAVATVLLLLVAPQVVLYTLAALGAAAQQARQRFALPAAAPALENLGLMSTMVAVGVLHGRGRGVGDVPVDAVLLMGVGATAAVAVHAAVQVVGAHRVGLSVRPVGGWRRDPQVRAVARRLRASVVVAAAPAAGLFVLLTCAATVPGGVLVLQMAFAVYVVPTALGARAVTTAVLPRMSAAAEAGDGHAYAAAWRQAVTYSAVVGLPALVVLVVFARPIASVLAAGALWTNDVIAALVAAICVVAVAQVFGGLYEVGRQALFASLCTRGPRRAAVLSLVVTTATAAVALLLPAGLPRLAGLCGALLWADLVAAGTVVRALRRQIRPEPAVDLAGLGAVALSAAAMLPALVLGWFLTRDDGGALADVGVMGTTAALAAVLFTVTLSTLRRRTAAA